MTLAHLVYVDAARVRIEIATRAPDGRWWSVFLERLDETLGLEALGIELALREIYVRPAPPTAKDEPPLQHSQLPRGHSHSMVRGGLEVTS